MSRKLTDEEKKKWKQDGWDDHIYGLKGLLERIGKSLGYEEMVWVKDEKYFDKFDKAFGAFFKEMEGLDDLIEALIPDDWLRNEFEKHLRKEKTVILKKKDFL